MHGFHSEPVRHCARPISGDPRPDRLRSAADDRSRANHRGRGLDDQRGHLRSAADRLERGWALRRVDAALSVDGRSWICGVQRRRLVLHSAVSDDVRLRQDLLGDETPSEVAHRELPHYSAAKCRHVGVGHRRLRRHSQSDA